MGWRADLAYDKAEREEWRRFMRAQPVWRRLNIYVWQFLFLVAVAVILAGPFVFSIIGSPS
ncbi:hypothetical protein [Mesorhizobium sp. DCY119]|uniref:hypothetical protein n=1 Tax=Mesorhizobium sp. DCY119 TaxID=2108445 RepID=UPI000E6C2144|nr:hypothetical protein [Mesorhizobium sp. DCY119]RJG46448.1 hypothetical protein D3Y55_20860 [Mesorhizobium sp. DCY119]